MKIVGIWVSCLCMVACLACTSTRTQDNVKSAEYFEYQLQVQSQKALAYLPEFIVDSTSFPRSTLRDGSLHATPSKSWTSGFYPGELWLLYEHSGDKQLMLAAKEWTAFIEKEKHDTHTHDLGFKVYCSFGQGYRLTQDPIYREIIVETSNTLIKRFNPTVGCIRSWDFNQDIWQFPVIIDNMMNLEMLFAATRLTGDSVYYQVAYQHALTTLKNHIRPDFSAYHVIDYDTLTGQVRNRHTHQGYSHESAWARGQAWNLYGFAMAYRETGDTRFLTHAQSVADYFYQHPNMHTSGVPYWDFDAPNIPHEPLDASAAAVAASGLLILCEVDSSCMPKLMPWIDLTLSSLSHEDFASSIPPFLLDHSVGSIPGDSEVDVPLIYADYYYVEALSRRIGLQKKYPDASWLSLNSSYNPSLPAKVQNQR